MLLRKIIVYIKLTPGINLVFKLLKNANQYCKRYTITGKCYDYIVLKSLYNSITDFHYNFISFNIFVFSFISNLTLIRLVDI